MFRSAPQDHHVRVFLIRYDAENSENNFILMSVVNDISASVELMDFSTDNFYLIFKDSFLKVTLIELFNMKVVNLNNIEYDL
jgi:hypothetical protein